MQRSIIIATKNKGKIREIRHILRPLKVDVLSLLDLSNVPKIKENGRTFKENAIKKARIICQKVKMLTLADDSGLEVEALGGKPGIRSARYAGANPTSEKLCRKLLNDMMGKQNRHARFVCNIAIAIPGKKIKIIEGICRGKITDKMMGGHGFGYDPVFIPQGYIKTFAQMTLTKKNKISHRSKAFIKAKAFLATFFAS